jgi:hypothetical protein
LLTSTMLSWLQVTPFASRPRQRAISVVTPCWRHRFASGSRHCLSRAPSLIGLEDGLESPPNFAQIRARLVPVAAR